LKEEEIRSLAFQEWVPLSIDEGSSYMSQFQNNLIKVGKSIKVWERYFQKRSLQNLSDTEKALNYPLTEKPAGSLSIEEEKELASLLIRKHWLLLQKEKMWRLKSRMTWLKEWDSNTKYFHRIAQSRKASNSISEIKDLNGDVVSSHEETWYPLMRRWLRPEVIFSPPYSKRSNAALSKKF
jgi:hypothetical protein